jgi:hypothetical protein
MPIRVFISHSSKDSDLVGFLVHALELSLVIPDGQIRCTSLPGYKPKVGSHTSTALRRELSEADVIIGVLTMESLESGWVMFELGAGWGANKWVVSVMAGVGFDALPGPLKENRATNAANRSEIEQLVEELGKELNFPRRQAGKATEIIDNLIEEAESYDPDDDGE